MLVFRVPYSYLEAVAMVHSGEMDEEELLELCSRFGNKVLRSNVAKLCEENDHIDLALQISNDVDYKFSLALKIGRLEDAMSYLAKSTAGRHSKSKYRLLLYKALLNADLKLAEECANRASDFSTLSIVHTLLGDKKKLEQTMEKAKSEGMMNHVFDIAFKIGRLDVCLEVLLASKRGCEATMFAANYLPERVQESFEQWKCFLREEGLNDEAERLVCPSSDILKASLTPNIPRERIQMCSEIPARHWPKMQSIALSSTHEDKTASLFRDINGGQPVVVDVPSQREYPPTRTETLGAREVDEPAIYQQEEETHDIAATSKPMAEEEQFTQAQNLNGGSVGEKFQEQFTQAHNPDAGSVGEKSQEGTSEFNTEDLEDISDLDDIDLDAPISDDDEL